MPAILLISEELDEILALADRVDVMYEGRIVGSFDAETADVHEIGLLMTGGGDQDDVPAAAEPDSVGGPARDAPPRAAADASRAGSRRLATIARRSSSRS